MMSNRLLATLVCSTCALAATPHATPQPQQQPFRAVADFVIVDASVQRAGRPAGDLTTADFELLDNGVVQKIVDASREMLPVDASFVLDLSDSVTTALLDTLERAVERVRKTSRPEDTVSIVAFNERARDVPATPGTLRSPATRAALGPLGKTSLHDAIAVTLPIEPRPGRRAMVLIFTDGLDTSSFLDESVVLEVARVTTPTVFAIALVSPRDQAAVERQEEFFAELTALTGGRYAMVKSNTDVDASFLRAVDEFRNAYVLRYSPQSVAPNGWHEITVKVKRSGNYTVRARRGYDRH